MCTVTWLQQQAGYQLFCNRDEKRSRGVALQPEVHLRDGVRYIAPVDADHGGSWISVNEFGVSVCLLNGDHPTLGLHAPERRSRGHIVTLLATATRTSDALATLRRQDLRAYDPFVLLLLAPDRPQVIARWNGVLLRLDPRAGEQNFLTSSSYDAAGVRRSRAAEFTQHRNRDTDPAEVMRAFHACHGAGESAYSTCMHRPDAETVSFSEVHVAPGKITFLYSPAAPCRQLPGKCLSMPLAA
jgi:hypothetical protein